MYSRPRRIPTIIFKVVIIVVVVSVIKVDAGSAQGNDLFGVGCLAHAVELVSVSAEAAVALIGDDHYVGADRPALPRDVIRVDILSNNGSQST